MLVVDPEREAVTPIVTIINILKSPFLLRFVNILFVMNYFF
jgi:hypothetical protein